MTSSPEPSTPLRRRVEAIRIYPLGEEPGDDLSATTTPEERVALVWELSRRMWELTGHPQGALSRDHLPVRVIRPA